MSSRIIVKSVPVTKVKSVRVLSVFVLGFIVCPEKG